MSKSASKLIGNRHQKRAHQCAGRPVHAVFLQPAAPNSSGIGGGRLAVLQSSQTVEQLVVHSATLQSLPLPLSQSGCHFRVVGIA